MVHRDVLRTISAIFFLGGVISTQSGVLFSEQFGGDGLLIVVVGSGTVSLYQCTRFLFFRQTFAVWTFTLVENL